MASSGSETERRAPKQAAEPTGRLAPPENGTHPPAGGEPVPRLRGGAGSARGPFERAGPPGCSEPGAVPAGRAPYMDSGYVTGVYSPGAARRPPPEPGVCPAGRAPARGAAARALRPCATARSEPGRRRDGRAAPRSPGKAEARQQDAAAAGRKVLGGKDVPASELKNGLAKSQNQGLKAGENGERSLSQEPVKRSNAHVFSRPSSFIFQEYLKTDSMASAPKILSAFNAVHAYKIPEEMNSKAYSLPHTNPNAVNDIQENKHYHCVVHRPNFREADLQSAVPEPGPLRRSLPHARCPIHAELHGDLAQDVFEDNHDLKHTENTLPIKAASKKLSSCADKSECCDSEGEMGNGVWDQQAKMRKSSVSRSLGSVEPEYPPCGELHQGNKPCCDPANQTAFFKPKENATSHFLNEFSKEKQAHNTSPDFAMHREQGKTAPPVCLHQPGLQNQPEKHLQGDVSSEQISRQTTPLLYYLSGGKTTDLLHQRKHTQLQEDLRSLPKKPSTSNYSASAQSTDVQREGNQLPKPQPNHQCIADDLDEAQDVLLGSPGSSVEESFKNDYREQLKVAQKRVLRETSFKRRDLQMSLPVRLRKKPSQRSSIEHLRSFSLSSANEVAKLVPGPPPHLQLVEHFSKDEEIKRTQLGRIGGRKRVTKEQKKMCFSEPEKLNQLEDKDVSWSQVRDEITDPSTAGRRPLESRGRALSSSAVSKTELKQIQQTALIEYMERKISQRPASSQHIPAPNPPVQKRPPHPKWPSDKASNPNKSRRPQNNEVLRQAFSEEEFPEVFAPVAPAAALSATCGCSRGAAAAGVSPQCHPRARGARGSSSSSSSSSSSRRGSTGSLPRAGAAGGCRERVSASPPCTQKSPGCASSAAPPARSRDPCPGCPSFHDAEKDGYKSHEDRDDNVAGSACCRDGKDLTPETSILVPKGGNREEPQVEEEHRIQSVNGNALINGPEPRLEVEDPAVPEVEAPRCRTAGVARPHRGANGTADGPERWLGANGSGPPPAEEASAQGTRDRVLPQEEKRLPERGLLSPEDQRYEELAKEVIAQDSSLAAVLMPRPIRKTALDLMEGLFPINVSLLDKSHRRRGDVQHGQENDRKGNKDLPAESPGAEHDAEQGEGDPVSKGNQTLNSSRDSTNDLDDITSKKMELAARLRSRLRRLGAERELVLREGRASAERGRALQELLRDVCRPNELERYTTFIGDLEKVVSLLLCLSSRLARVQDAMSKIDGNTDAEEKQSLNERHKLLSRQREDAKDLKENLDRRERVVSGILAKYLTHQQLQDYRHFVQVKTSLLIEQKDLEEQIKLLEEQLETLEKSIRA